MKCPICGNPDTRVIDSREAGTGDAIRRRRECESCHRRFTTYERAEEFTPRVIKKDGSREEFSRSKLMAGLSRACQKTRVSSVELEGLYNSLFFDFTVKSIPDKILFESIMLDVFAIEKGINVSVFKRVFQV